jgi:hypothetical protein
VVYNFMDVLLRGKTVISNPSVSVDSGAAFDLVVNRFLKGFALDVRNDPSANIATVTVKHSHNDSFANHVIVSRLHLQATRPMHLARMGPTKVSSTSTGPPPPPPILNIVLPFIASRIR